MHTKITKIIFFLIVSFPTLSFAGGGSSINHAFRTETDIGNSRDGTVYSWDFDGWVGSDYNKLWLKSEGDKTEGETVEDAEFWAMYSRNIARFWDVQVGIRYDDRPNSTTYLTAGLEGLAYYFFETEAHLFVSEDGNLTARIRQENDLLITQRLITQPYFEFNLSAQEVPELGIGSGVTSGEFGIQTRYEFSRKFAPYIDFSYDRKFGSTSAITRKDSKNRDAFIARVGLRLLF